jgi:hypothetical protein
MFSTLYLINNHVFTSELQFDVKEIKKKLIDNRIIVIPETLGKGQLYFTEVMSGVSALIIDAVFTSQIIVKPLKSDLVNRQQKVD